MENKAQTQTNGPVKMTQRQFDALLDQLNSQSNLTKGVALAFIMGVLGAAVWAGFVWVTQYNIGLIAVFVGFLISQGFVFAGRGSKQIAGIIAAVIAVLAILLGNVAVLVLQVAQYYSEPVLTTIGAIDWTQVPGAMLESAAPMDLLFYIFALQVAFSRSYVRESKLNVIIVPEGTETSETNELVVSEEEVTEQEEIVEVVTDQEVIEEEVTEKTAGDRDVF